MYSNPEEPDISENWGSFSFLDSHFILSASKLAPLMINVISVPIQMVSFANEAVKRMESSTNMVIVFDETIGHMSELSAITLYWVIVLGDRVFSVSVVSSNREKEDVVSVLDIHFKVWIFSPSAFNVMEVLMQTESLSVVSLISAGWKTFKCVWSTSAGHLSPSYVTRMVCELSAAFISYPSFEPSSIVENVSAESFFV